MPPRHLIKVARKLPGVGWGETGTGMCVGKVTWAVRIVREKTSRNLALRQPKVGGRKDENNPQWRLQRNSQ